MELTFKVTRLTPQTPESTQNALKKALQAVEGVTRVRLIPESGEFAIIGDDAVRAEVILAATKAGFRVRNNTGH